MATKSIYFDGTKSISINQLPPEAWTALTGGANLGDVQKYHRAVPWLYRGTDLRANAVASMPFALVETDGDEYDTSDDYQNKIGFMPHPGRLLFLLEAALCLMGRAYLFKSRNLLKTLGLRYLLPSTVHPQFNKNQDAGPLGQLVGFQRTVNNRTVELAVEDVAYFWLPDAFTEIGPPADGACPGQAALIAAGVLHNLGQYAAAYFERGAIRPLIMTVPAPAPPEAEQSRLRSWLNRTFMGGNKNAFRPHILPEGTDVKYLGDGLGELSDTNLTKEQREDIAVALGIPMTVLWSTEAGGLGGGGVVESDERKFYEQTIVPEARFIASVLNEQLFEAMRLRLVFRPETLDVFQQDENQRAQALTHYVNAGYRLSIASQLLGIELPEGIDYDDLDDMKREDKEEAAARMPEFGNPQGNPQNGRNPQAAAMRADLRKWRTKARKAGGAVPFESDHIPEPLMKSIAGAIEEQGVDEAFAFLKKKRNLPAT